MQTINTWLGGSGGMILYFVVIIAVFYFLLIRPQKKRDKEAKQMMAAMKKGDRVITIGGFYGKILSVKDDVVTLDLGQDNKVKIEKTAIKSVTKAADAEENEEAEDTEE